MKRPDYDTIVQMVDDSTGMLRKFTVQYNYAEIITDLRVYDEAGDYVPFVKLGTSTLDKLYEHIEQHHTDYLQERNQPDNHGELY